MPKVWLKFYPLYETELKKNKKKWRRLTYVYVFILETKKEEEFGRNSATQEANHRHLAQEWGSAWWVNIKPCFVQGSLPRLSQLPEKDPSGLSDYKKDVIHSPWFSYLAAWFSNPPFQVVKLFLRQIPRFMSGENGSQLSDKRKKGNLRIPRLMVVQVEG